MTDVFDDMANDGDLGEQAQEQFNEPITFDTIEADQGAPPIGSARMGEVPEWLPRDASGQPFVPKASLGVVERLDDPDIDFHPEADAAALLARDMGLPQIDKRAAARIEDNRRTSTSFDNESDRQASTDHRNDHDGETSAQVDDEQLTPAQKMEQEGAILSAGQMQHDAVMNLLRGV